MNTNPMKSRTWGKNASQFNPEKIYITSVKYDGHLIKIVQEGNSTRYFTSDDKEFSLPIDMPYGHYEAHAEFNYDCQGKLGDRRKCGILTTSRVNFAKGLSTKMDTDKIQIMVFDIVSDLPYYQRMTEATKIGLPVTPQWMVKGREAIEWAKELSGQGWEGVMLRTLEGKFVPGPHHRSHDSIKVKFKHTADLLCIAVEKGEGKCEGIGALVLQDSKGRVVRVGSGLEYSPEIRQNPELFVGKVVEISYEQIMDTYVQPVFVAVRDEKTKEEID